MQNITSVLNYSIPCFLIKCMSPGLNITPRKPEQPTAADHRHLPHL
ncbi:hypothetical protein SLEP1_g52999 [Rubroshorea leprosula]|uniref:Uncharacterized protein n=1 Tax=Rubroshorea leprosula TaxID=152421 RepID=A0AAV5M9T4_9ROSI|nr:hypothetical protein SLEP1_g52999 [Rubroshorea leprosula]